MPRWLPRWYWLIAPVWFVGPVATAMALHGPRMRGMPMAQPAYMLPIAVGLLWLFWACPVLYIRDRSVGYALPPRRRLRLLQLLSWTPVIFMVFLGIVLSMMFSAMIYLPPPPGGAHHSPVARAPSTAPTPGVNPGPAPGAPGVAPARSAPSQFTALVGSMHWAWHPQTWGLLAAAALATPFTVIFNRRLKKGFLRTLQERQICFHCGYDLRGTPPPRACPECGWDRVLP